MIHIPWIKEPLTEERVRHHFMLTLDDDTEEKPWMTMSDLQFWSASSLAHSLRIYSREQRLPWYVASMLPILYRWPGAAIRKQLAPDLFVALAPDHPRSSFDTEEEGGFPPFVLEVVSPSSHLHDENDKYVAYEELGALEYVLFTPRADGSSSLEGHWRAGGSRFVPWPRDDRGRLWSEVLKLFFVVDGSILRAETSEGQRLLSPDETNVAWHQAELSRRTEAQARQEEARARQEEAQARQEEARARRVAEAEVERLRQEIERLRHGQ